MAPSGKPASFVMQKSSLQLLVEGKKGKEQKSSSIPSECVLFAGSIMSGRWNPTNPSLGGAREGSHVASSNDGPEPRVLSKKRRDLINAEIRELQNLLPLKKSARERLSYLGILALTNTYIRKATFFKNAGGGSMGGTSLAENWLVGEFSSSLPGFLIVFNKEGKILYTSDNILDYLGNTVVELASQGDSIFDFVDKEDHDQIRSQLEYPGSHAPNNDHSNRISFFCRMSTSRYMKTQMRSWKNKIVHVTGKYHRCEVAASSGEWSSDIVFFVICSPVESKPVTDVRHHPSPRASEFKAIHASDMKFIEVPNVVESLLGHKREDMENTSWYQWIYPQDLTIARQQHLKFVKEDGSAFSCVLRMIKKDGSLVWVDVTAEKSQENISNSFICNYILISEEEVPYFRIYHNFLPFPDHYSESQRHYLAYRSTLLTSALNNVDASAATSPITSPSGELIHTHPYAPHYYMTSASATGAAAPSDGDTKTILRRQLMKRKLSGGEPPSKMLLRTTSDISGYPYTAAAHHQALQHSNSYPDSSSAYGHHSHHPHHHPMIYPPPAAPESFMAQLHSPDTAPPGGYLFESGYTTLAPVRPEALQGFQMMTSHHSPAAAAAITSTVTLHKHHNNQNNNIQQQQQQSSNYLPTNCYRPISTYSPTTASTNVVTPPATSSDEYYQQQRSSSTSNHSPVTRQIALTSSIAPRAPPGGSTPSPVSSPQEQQRHKRLQSACPGPNQIISAKQEVPSPSSNTFHGYPPTAAVSSPPGTSPYNVTPTNSPTYQQYAAPVTSSFHEAAPCEKTTPYQIQYSISTTTQPSPAALPGIGQYHQAAAAAAYYAAAASHSYGRGGSEVSAHPDPAAVGSPEWLRKYGNMSAMEMLFSETDTSPRLA